MLIALCLSIALQQQLPLAPALQPFVWTTCATRAGVQALELEIEWPATAGTAFPVVLVVEASGAGAVRERAQRATIEALLARGLAVATTTIRSSREAEFPAQVHDLKGAVRFLRANAQRLRLDAGRIGVWGEGDGATLAALLGTSGNVAALEGDVGGNRGVSSRVQAVVEVSGWLDLEAEFERGGAGVPTERLVGVPTSVRDLSRTRRDAPFIARGLEAVAVPVASPAVDAGLVEDSVEVARAENANGEKTRAEKTLAVEARDDDEARASEPEASTATGRVSLAFLPRSRAADAEATDEHAARRSAAARAANRAHSVRAEGAVSALEPELEPIAPAELLRFANPRRHVSADDPPMFLAEAQTTLGAQSSQARTMRERLLEHGVTVVLSEWPVGQSGFGAEHLPRATLASAAEFARSVLVNSCSIAPIGMGQTNSLGSRAAIWSTGLATPSTPFWLHVEGAVPNTTGSFVFSDGPGGARTLAGESYVSEPNAHLEPVTTDARGHAVRRFAVPAEWIGRTLFFQFEYHDQGIALRNGSGFVLSSGGRVTICR